MYQPARASLGELFKRVHQDERGVVSLETILVVAAIAIPVILFIYKIGWPKISKIFTDGLEGLGVEADRISNPADTSGIN